MAFSMWAPMFCVPPIEKALSDSLGLSHTQTSLLYIAPIIMLAATAIPGGLLADRIGIRRAAGVGVIIIALGSALRATADSTAALMGFTFMFGTGLGLVFPNLPKLISGWVPPEKAGMTTGLIISGILVGISVSLAITIPLVLPITNTYQGVFLFWSIFPIVGVGLWWTLVKEPPRHPSETPPPQGTGFRHVLQNRNLWLAAGLLLLHNFFFYNWAGWAPTLLQMKGASPDLAGLISSIAIWASIPAALLVPRLAYRLRVRKPFLWISSILLALAAWRAIGMGIPQSWGLMVLVGVANLTRFITIMALPVETLPPQDVGRASGLMLAIGYSGGVIGTLVGGRILDITGSLDKSLLALVAVSAAATVIALKLPETAPGASDHPAADTAHPPGH